MNSNSSKNDFESMELSPCSSTWCMDNNDKRVNMSGSSYYLLVLGFAWSSILEGIGELVGARENRQAELATSNIISIHEMDKSECGLNAL
jgi:hypothetical protein